MPVNSGLAPRVFVSHASEDRPWAQAICHVLEEAGVRCWIAPRDVPAGANYGEAIITALDSCRVLVLVFSSHAANSDMVMREVERAAAKGLHILPVKVVEGAPIGTRLEFYLSTAQWIDGSRPPRTERLSDVVSAVQLALGARETTAAPRGSAAPGHIGPYRLLSVIGEGGFGQVWLAERREPIVQRVAIKLIKPGMDTKAVIARFEQERQALAIMDHPGVAKVLDAGSTPDGRPYFVMDLVKGEAITTYCDRQRLAIKERLLLFEKVCDAVHHAHMKGLIHRDLKPSNILVAVSEQGELRPVVIDFGVAKAIAARLTEKTIFTEQGALIGTPEYMSPEQAEMAETDIDTRSDIYALGVVLYELLTGVLPFDAKALREGGYAGIQRIIREVDPPRPSNRLTGCFDAATARRTDPDHLIAELRRELEWIPLKALRKDRSDRYRSAAELGDEVRSYLDNRPLLAGPETTAYRVRKFVRRYRTLVAVSGTALLVVTIALITTSLFLVWALRAEEEVRLQLIAIKKAEDEQKAAEGRAAFAQTERVAADMRADAAEKTLGLPVLGGAPGVLPVGNLLLVADTFTDSLLKEIPEIPEIGHSQYRSTIVLSGIVNKTKIADSDFEVVMHRIKSKLLQSQPIRDLVKFIVNNDELKRLQVASGEPAREGQPLSRPSSNPDYTYTLGGTFFEASRGQFSYYYFDLRLTRLSDGAEVWSHPFEFLQNEAAPKKDTKEQGS